MDVSSVSLLFANLCFSHSSKTRPTDFPEKRALRKAKQYINYNLSDNFYGISPKETLEKPGESCHFCPIQF